MPKAGQCLHTIERIENASAQASTARLRLEQLEILVCDLARRGAISEYNTNTALCDINEVRMALKHLQDELCEFRGQ